MTKYIYCAVIWMVSLVGTVSFAENNLKFGENLRLDELFATLQTPDGSQAQSEVLLIFRQSGSASMDLLLSRGFHAIDDGDPKLAIWHFSALIDQAPDFAEAYNGRATAFYELGELGLAVADIQATLALNPRQFVSLTGMGFVQEELGNLDEALAAYRAAYSLNPHFEGLAEAIERVEADISILH